MHETMIRLPSNPSKKVYALSKIGSGEAATLIVAGDIQEAAEIAEDWTGVSRKSLKWDLVLLQVGTDSIRLISPESLNRPVYFRGITEPAKKIPAIKKIRELLGCGLYDAKVIVESDTPHLLEASVDLSDQDIIDKYRQYGIIVSIGAP